MKIYDISMQIHPDMPVYKNKEEKRPRIETLRDFEGEHGARESRLTIELHTGTHMDTPLHMIQDGQDSAFFNVEDMVVPCTVLDLTDAADRITEADLKGKDIQADAFVLLKTKNSFEKGFNPQFIFVDAAGAQYLADCGIKGVGIDSLGIERSQPDHATHKILLGQGIHILEGLRLKDIEPGRYTLIAAPLNIAGVEAGPVRALLLDGRI